MSKLKKNAQYLDSMVIGAGHTIMLGNVPDQVMGDKGHLLKLSDNILAWRGTTRESVETYGFWGSDIDYNTYYNQLIQNRKVTPAYKVYANKLEEDKVNEISELLQAAKSSGDNSTLKLKVGSSVNMHHKGKVTFEDPARLRRITIDNKRDVDLLHMKHRKEFLDKKYATQIREEIGELTHGVHDDEGFE